MSLTPHHAKYFAHELTKRALGRHRALLFLSRRSVAQDEVLDGLALARAVVGRGVGGDAGRLQHPKNVFSRIAQFASARKLNLATSKSILPKPNRMGVNPLRSSMRETETLPNCVPVS